MARLPEETDYGELLNELRDDLRGLKAELTNMAIATDQNIKKNEAARLKALVNIYEQAKTLEEQKREFEAESSVLNEQRQIEALQRIFREQKQLQESYKEALDARGINAETDPQRAADLKKRLEDTQAIEKASRNASDYLNRLPLIGKKLGERGNILDVFQQIDNITDKVSGKLVNRKNAAQVYGVSEQELSKGTNLKNELETAKEKATKGTAEEKEKYQKLLDAFDRLRTTMEHGDDQAKAKAKQQFQEARGKEGQELDEKELAAAEAQLAASEATKAGWANATAILANLAQKLEGKMDELALDKAKVDTRLYGSRNDTKWGSYWSATNAQFAPLMLSPVVKMEAVMQNVKTVIDMGIARDYEQIAMLASIKDKIAQTFDVFDGSVRRLIKIQDETTSAARLGMESMLNKFLNNMYETTEYLKNIASQVRSSLVEAEALMDAQSAVDFEFQVQKWLGSLSSVGVSDSGVSSIASALGQLAAGQVESITNGGVGNLLVMAANNGNLSIADILADGLNASETNVLLNQMVGYMHDLVVEANGNKVVQQQLAKVFGLTASDLRAAENLIYKYNGQTGQMKTIFNTGTGKGGAYNQALAEVWSRADSMFTRTSVGEMLTNIWDNIQFATASGMASNPATYIAMKVADILDTFAGGIPIPSISVMGNGVDTKLTVSNIMKAASMVTGFTSSLIGAMGGMAQGHGSMGSGLLRMVGVESPNLLALMGLQNTVTRGASTSSSGEGTIYNASVEDTTGSATQQGKDQAKQEQVSAQEESTDVTNETLNESILNIYNLLSDVVNGASTLSVSIDKMNMSPVNGIASVAWG